ncbi:uncharacterized mitochondrial protein AtMg00810-like [Rutidosis leptorrhynchoides]|uniref:uncharacterized mitochondrial protein AtMg00810-like n=1 Tax=Rutidosis leptorrhynchoides TaxID=125765 RepID=UPI003A98D6EB
MTLPQGYKHNQAPNSVCRLLKSLYGLKQANRQWFTKLTSYLLTQGFCQSYADTSLLTFAKDSIFLAIVIYVDDLLITGNNESLISTLKDNLHKTFSIKDLGNTNYYLGIEFLRTKEGITMSQRKYALELLNTAGILDQKPSNVPIDPNIKLSADEGEFLDDASLYRTLVGKLIYLTITRPDLSYAAQALSQFSQNPRTSHLTALYKVLRYIKFSPGQGLHFPHHNTLTLSAFCDSDWANCPTSRRSITGYCIFLGSCLISWQSKKQKVVSRSSTEAEYRALADCTCELTWLKSLLHDFQVPCQQPIPIYCDNASAIALASNPIQHARTKHIEIDCHFVRDKMKAGQISTIFIPSSQQVADVLTKGLSKTPHHKCISKFGICDPYTMPTCGGIMV